MMTLYPPLEGGETHRLQLVAEVRFRLEKEQAFRASMYKKYRRWANFVDGLDTALSVTSVGLAATGACRPWSSSRDDCVWAAGDRREIGRPEASSKDQKHDLIHSLAESKLNTIADGISTVLTDNQITEKEFSPNVSEVDKYNQMKAEIREHQKQSGGLPKDEKNRLFQCARDEAMMTARAKLLKERHQAGNT